MKVLAIGCTGSLGLAAVRALVARGVSVRCLTRYRPSAKIHNLPWGAREYVADLDKPETLDDALSYEDAVLLVVPVGPNETRQGLSAVAAAKKAGVQKIVYISVYMPEGSERVPHFRSKLPIERAVIESGLAYTILRPNNYFQNDAVLKDRILRQGLYPVPLGSVGLNRVDVRDVADSAVNSLMKSDFEGRIFSIHGPHRLGGKDIARIYSTYTGRDVHYAGDDLKAWETDARNLLPGWLVEDMRAMYAFFQEHGMVATGLELEAQHKIVGHPGRTFDSYAVELVQEWNQTKIA